ncbi:hypothetical protein BDV12DRAFT_200637 [Aspergillus spectabilis]
MPHPWRTRRNEKYRTYAKGHGNLTAEKTKNVGWNNLENTRPPVHFFEGDPAIGLYSVQFIAMDRVTWDSIPGTKKCNIQGLCNPQYIFYRKGYTAVLNTWESQGRVSGCQYSGGEDCLGLCSCGVKDQFATGGICWGRDCEIPCTDDVPDDCVVYPNEEATFMAVGDSSSHGMKNDWTWRYPLGQWYFDVPAEDDVLILISLQAPLLPDEEPPEPIEVVGSYAKGHKPDYLLILLGFNYLGWWVSGPETLVGEMGNLVQAARAAKPDITLLVGNVAHRTFIERRKDLVDNTSEYNILLWNRLPNWFQRGSPIAAQAFTRVLRRDFGYEGIEFRIPDKVNGRPVSTPVNVRTSAWPEGLRTRWGPVKNKRGYEIRGRVNGATGWWSEGVFYPSTHGSWQPWVINGQTWEYQVRTKGDNNVRSDWSELSSATANVDTAPGPSNIIIEPQGTDVLLRWDAVTGFYVGRYGVYVWDRDTDAAWLMVYPTETTSVVVKGLTPGIRYGIWVAAYIGVIGSLTRQSVSAGGLPAPAICRGCDCWALGRRWTARTDH